LEKIRFKEGANNIETITSMRQDLSQEASKIPQIEKVIEQSENTIRLLLNQNPGQVKTKLTLMQLDVKKVLPRRLPSSVLKNRPDILIAVNNVKMACAQIGVSYSTFFPTLALSGLLGESSIDLTHLLKLSTAFWVSQAYASMSLLNASAYQNVKSAKAGLKAASYDYLETLHSVFADVDTNLTNEQKNLQAYALIEQATQAAQKTYGIALAQYQAGAKDYRAVLNAKINLDRNKLNLIQQKAQVMDGLVQVYNAIAGGSEVYIKKQRQ
jgi:outer membrane protein TolC